MKKLSEEVPISELLLEIPKKYSCKETLFWMIGYWQTINYVQMLLSVHGKFNLFCFSELSFNAYKLAEFGPRTIQSFPVWSVIQIVTRKVPLAEMVNHMGMGEKKK